MLRARAALVAGLLVVLAGFAYGVEAPTSTTVAGQHVRCGAAISASWLVSGTPETYSVILDRAEARQRSTACRSAVQRVRLGVFSAMAAGGLLALVGWTVLRGPGTPRRAARREARTA